MVINEIIKYETLSIITNIYNQKKPFLHRAFPFLFLLIIDGGSQVKAHNTYVYRIWSLCYFDFLVPILKCFVKGLLKLCSNILCLKLVASIRIYLIRIEFDTQVRLPNVRPFSRLLNFAYLLRKQLICTVKIGQVASNKLNCLFIWLSQICFHEISL